MKVGSVAIFGLLFFSIRVLMTGSRMGCLCSQPDLSGRKLFFVAFRNIFYFFISAASAVIVRFPLTQVSSSDGS